MFKWKRLLSVVAVILVLIIIQARNYNIDGPFRGLLGNIVNPVIYVADKAFSCVGNIWNSYIYLVNVQKRNDEYKSHIDDLTLENILLKEKVIQGERLQSFVRFYKSYDFNRIPCNVIGVSGGYVKNIVIDAGAVDGVEKNDPVIGFHGLVGRVTAVYAASSDVDVILNISSNVSVMNSRTRVTGILRGDGKGRLYV
ncbi:MAG: rod shape-determining protein MreC, partial [Mucispirillum sp.]|nr:rod shape-determining protein MreC [Mucispirillum sp.]